MEYIPYKNEVFCFPCRLFAGDCGNHSETFRSKGFSSWSHIIFRAKEHEKSQHHLSACQRLEYAKHVDLHPDETIADLLNKQRMEDANNNMEYLKIVLDCLHFLASQGLAMRGHDESINSISKGNFLELLNRLTKYCSLVQKFLHKGKTFTFTSPSIQNELRDILASNITNQIINNIKKSNWFSIIIDECQDLSNDCQVAFVMKYIIDEMIERESFLGFRRTTSQTGSSVSQLIINTLKENDLDIYKCVSQC